MTIALALLAVLVAVAVVAVILLVRDRHRTLRDVNRDYARLLREQREHETEVLDRMMFAAGKPWRDTADRPDEPIESDPFARLATRVTEDPIAGGYYAGDEIFDSLEADLRSADGDRVFIPAATFDTADLEDSL